MHQLVKNFARSLKKSFTQIIGLIAALLILIGLFTGFWISADYGYKQISRIEGDYVDSMVVGPTTSKLNTNLWTNVSWNLSAKESVDEFYNNSTIQITHHANMKGVYDLTLYNPNTGINLGKEAADDDSHQPAGVVYTFRNPFLNNPNSKFYINFDQLCTNTLAEKNVIHLLPTIKTDTNEAITKDLLGQYFDIYQNEFQSVVGDNFQFTQDADDCTNLYNISKTILWNAILGMNSKDFRYAQYFSFKDPNTETNYVVFPDLHPDDYHSYSNPIFKNDQVRNPLANHANDIYISKNYADYSHLKLGDSFTFLNEKFRITDYAVNAIYNSNLAGSFKYSAGIWVSPDRYLALLDSARGLAGFQTHSDMYYNADDLSVLNAQLFTNGVIDSKNDAHGDVYYTNHLLSLFLRMKPNDLSNFYYKVPRPDTQFDETMGVHLQLGIITQRNTTLFSVLLVAAAVLELASIVMVVVVISHLIKHNEKSLGVLKANGLGSLKISFAISICFMLVLIFTGILAIVFSALIGYVLDLTYQGFTQMTDYSFTFVWYIALIDFALPIVLIIPFVAIFAFALTRKSPLMLIKGTVEKKIKLISFKRHFDPFKWIKRIRLNFKHKLAFKFAFAARGKLFLTIVISLISTIGLYIVFNLMQTDSAIFTNVNQQFVAPYIYGFNNQQLVKENGQTNFNYNYYDIASEKTGLFNNYELGREIQDQYETDIYDANHNLHHIYEILPDHLHMPLKDCWIKAEILKEYAKDLPTPIKNIYDNYKDQIETLAKNHGIICIGFEFYDSRSEELALTQMLNVYQLADKKAKNILIFNNNNNNSGWIDNAVVQGILNQHRLLKVKGAEVISYPNYNYAVGKLKIIGDHYSPTDFMKAPIDLNDSKLKLQFALANGNRLIDDSLTLLRDHLIGDWHKMGIKNINVLPVMVNKFFDTTQVSKIGDILFSNNPIDNSLDAYVIYDWLDTLNQQFMVVPYQGLVGNIYQKHLTNDSNVYNWKLSSNTDSELHRQISIISEDNNYNITGRNYGINLNFILLKEMILDTLHSANNSLLLIIQVIGILTIILTVVQVTVTMNIIMKSNINTINLLKSFGYSKRWIFNRLFTIYIPLIILSGILAFPFGYLISYFTYVQVVNVSMLYVPFIVSLPSIIVIAIAILIIFAVILAIVQWYNERNYPVFKFIT